MSPAWGARAPPLGPQPAPRAGRPGPGPLRWPGGPRPARYRWSGPTPARPGARRGRSAQAGHAGGDQRGQGGRHLLYLPGRLERTRQLSRGEGVDVKAGGISRDGFFQLAQGLAHRPAPLVAVDVKASAEPANRSPKSQGNIRSRLSHATDRHPREPTPQRPKPGRASRRPGRSGTDLGYTTPGHQRVMLGVGLPAWQVAHAFV